MAEDGEPPDDPAAAAIDVVLRTFSWAFLPLIVFVGLSLAAARGQTFPIRVGAPRDPLDFAVPTTMSRTAPLSTTARLIAASAPLRDPILEDLTDSARSLSLPPSEQRRETRLQELEDERLESCRSASAFSFDQCFFFGSIDASDSRRAMEGGGKLPRSAAAASDEARPSQQPAKQQPRRTTGIPTW